MAQYRIDLSANLANTLVNSSNEDFESIILYKMPNLEVDRWFMGMYTSDDNGNFTIVNLYNRGVNDQNYDVTVLTENYLAMNKVSDLNDFLLSEQGIDEDLVLVYFPRSEITRLIRNALNQNLIVDATPQDSDLTNSNTNMVDDLVPEVPEIPEVPGPNVSLYFTHSVIDIPKEESGTVTNKRYLTLTASINSGTPNVARNHEIATSVAAGVPCPPVWDIMKYRFYNLVLENSIGDFRTIPYGKIALKKPLNRV